MSAAPEGGAALVVIGATSCADNPGYQLAVWHVARYTLDMTQTTTPAPVHTVTLVATDTARVHTGRSRELFTVVAGASGERVRNPGHAHRVMRFEGRDGFTKLYLMPQPVVIALHHAETDDVDAGELAFGDVIEVDGERYVVTSRTRQLADPELVRLWE